MNRAGDGGTPDGGGCSRSVLLGVRRTSGGGGPWPGTGRLQPGASATTGKAARARRMRRRWRPPTPSPRIICCVTTLLSSKALLCLIALLLVAEDEPGRVALHLGGDAVKNHNQLACLGQEVAQLVEPGVGEVADRLAILRQHLLQLAGGAVEVAGGFLQAGDLAAGILAGHRDQIGRAHV